MSTYEPDDWRLIVRPVKSFPGPHGRRMARLIKAMLRDYGFRCIELGPASARSVSGELLDSIGEVTNAATEGAKDYEPATSRPDAA